MSSDVFEKGETQPPDSLGDSQGVGQILIRAILGSDRLEKLHHRLGDHVENGRGELAHRLDRLRILVLQRLEQCLHGQGAEGIVLDDRLVGHPEERQQKSREHPCAVFACTAVQDGGECVLVGQSLNCPGSAGAPCTTSWKYRDVTYDASFQEGSSSAEGRTSNNGRPRYRTGTSSTGNEPRCSASSWVRRSITVARPMSRS